MNLQKLLETGANKLVQNNIKTPKLDAELLLSNVLKKTREQMLIDLNSIATTKTINEFNTLIELRKRNKPVAQIIGYKFFWKSKFYINDNVLIPRPETELIVQKAINEIPKNLSMKILDVGTGSGCIIISILKERPLCMGTALDISKKSIKVAKTNAEMHQIKNNLKFLNIDIDKYIPNNYDLIVSNPPYISVSDLLCLEVDVKRYEPKLALLGGNSGLDKVFRLIDKSSKLLKLNGKLIFEIGHGQKKQVVKYLKVKKFYINSINKDYAGIDRCIVSTKI